MPRVIVPRFATRRSFVSGLAACLAATLAGGRTARGADRPVKADSVLVLKSERRLHLLKDGTPYRSYPIRLGANPVGPKVFARDGRTPEGVYVIDSRLRNSSFHRSLHISYPEPDNVARARQYGLPPGGNIRIHGTPPQLAKTSRDWTDGCIAVSNAAIEEIWDAVDDGTPIEIRP